MIARSYIETKFQKFPSQFKNRGFDGTYYLLRVVIFFFFSFAKINSREQGVDDAQAGEQRSRGDDLLGDGARLADGPHLHHRVLVRLALELELEQDVRDVVVALGRDVGDGALGAGRDEHGLRDQPVLGHRAEDVAARDVLAYLSWSSKYHHDCKERFQRRKRSTLD